MSIETRTQFIPADPGWRVMVETPNGDKFLVSVVCWHGRSDVHRDEDKGKQVVAHADPMVVAPEGDCICSVRDLDLSVAIGKHRGKRGYKVLGLVAPGESPTKAEDVRGGWEPLK